MAVRSSLHSVKSKGKSTKRARGERGPPAGAPLPCALTEEAFLAYDLRTYDLREHVARMLSRCGDKLGRFARNEGSVTDLGLAGNAVAAASSVLSTTEDVVGDEKKPALELFQLDETAFKSKEKQILLSRTLLDDEGFLLAFDKLVKDVCIPHLKKRLVKADALRFDKELCFYYQRPPTLRLQRGPSE